MQKRVGKCWTRNDGNGFRVCLLNFSRFLQRPSNSQRYRDSRVLGPGKIVAERGVRSGDFWGFDVSVGVSCSSDVICSWYLVVENGWPYGCTPAGSVDFYGFSKR